MASKVDHVFCGSFIHSLYSEPAVYLESKALGLIDGKIAFFEDLERLCELQEIFEFPTTAVYSMNAGEFMVPGFIDAHIHAPQFPNIGCALDLPLLEWLEKYTFPTEARFCNLEYAEKEFSKVVKNTLKNGTTTASYFCTIHANATIALCDIIEKAGQRGFLGKCNIDKNCPEYYTEETSASLEDTEKFIHYVVNKKNPLLTPVITPRFALSCSSSLMLALANLAQKYSIPIQTHISENKAEIDAVLKEFTGCSSYTEVYDDHTLLTPKSYLAHGIYLSDHELDILKSRRSGVVHCPNSNISLRSGLCDVRRLLDKGVKVGLGTDVSGGYSSSMLDAMRNAVQVSKIISIEKPSYKHLTHEEAFCICTLGNSQILGINDMTGNFQVGKEFDALLISTSKLFHSYDSTKEDSLKESFERFIFTGDDRNIKEVYVAGQMVASLQT